VQNLKDNAPEKTGAGSRNQQRPLGKAGRNGYLAITSVTESDEYCQSLTRIITWSAPQAFARPAALERIF
jgi:hypothetical protein